MNDSIKQASTVLENNYGTASDDEIGKVTRSDLQDFRLSWDFEPNHPDGTVFLSFQGNPDVCFRLKHSSATKLAVFILTQLGVGLTPSQRADIVREFITRSELAAALTEGHTVQPGVENADYWKGMQDAFAQVATIYTEDDK